MYKKRNEISSRGRTIMCNVLNFARKYSLHLSIYLYLSCIFTGFLEINTRSSSSFSNVSFVPLIGILFDEILIPLMQQVQRCGLVFRLQQVVANIVE